MVDWQAYPKDVPLTPYRLHATHRSATPVSGRGSYLELGNFEVRVSGWSRGGL